MELFPEEVRNLLPPLYAQEHEKDPMVYVKFFHPLSYWTWYAYEGSPEGDDFIFFGWVYGDFPELGYFSLNELESVKGPLGIGIERDLYFSPTRLSEVKKRHPEYPSREPNIVVYMIDEEEPDFSPLALLAQRMATLYLAVNYKRPDWLGSVDKTCIHDTATKVFTRIAPAVKAVYEVNLVEMAKEVFTVVFENQVQVLLPDYQGKLQAWQNQKPTQEPDHEG